MEWISYILVRLGAPGAAGESERLSDRGENEITGDAASWSEPLACQSCVEGSAIALRAVNDSCDKQIL